MRIPRTTARVLPDDLEADGNAAQPDMPDVMRRAVAAVRGTP